ncbi:malate/lactate/ureidoglycolate dehydrogenase [Thermodesulfobacteriota bacterium]
MVNQDAGGENKQIILDCEMTENLITEIFAAKGCNAHEAATIAMRLCGANLRGHDSHGIIRVPRYADRMDQGMMFANKRAEMVIDGAAFAVMDGQRGFGQTIGEQAVDAGIARAKQNGLAIVGLRNSGHLGRIGDWAERAAAENLVSMHFVNVRGSLLVAPFGGSDRRMSTSPLAIGIPVQNGDPIILDMATSTVAEGKALVAFQSGKSLPDGALVDSAGNPSTDPRHLYGDVPEGEAPNPGLGPGALTPFGLHKGSGLNFMMEMLAGALTGSGCTAGIDDTEKRPLCNGMLSVYISPEVLGDLKAFTREVKSYAAFVKASPPSDPGAVVLIPGEKELITMRDRQKNGLPLAQKIWDEITLTAIKNGVKDTDRFAQAVIG